MTAMLQAGAPSKIQLDLESDWHVGTGYGLPGGVDARVRRGPDGRPYLPGTAVTGLFSDAANLAARAFDSLGGGWVPFATELFGTTGRPALIRFDPGHAVTEAGVSELRIKPGVAIDEDSGRARDNMLRFIEVTPGGTLEAGVELLAADAHGDTIAWTDEQRLAATAVLAVAAGLVDRIGGDRNRGLGRCRATLPDVGQVKDWLAHVEARPTAPPAPHRVTPPAGHVPPSRRRTGAAAAGWVSVRLEMRLEAPLLASAGTRGNVLTSHDRVPGTVVLAWAHRVLRSVAAGTPAEEEVRNAVTAGRLLATNATPLLDDQPGLPVPFSLLRDKLRGLNAPVVNRLIADEPNVQHTPLRRGYISTTPSSTSYRYISVTPVLAMHNTFNPALGRTLDTGLYTVEAIPAGTVLAADLLLDADLARGLPLDWSERLTGSARLGGKAKSEYGRVKVDAGPPVEISFADIDASQEMTMWLTSDTVVRDDRLRPGGLDELLTAFRRAGVPLIAAAPDWVTSPGEPIVAATRTRRIDGWYGPSGTPRPTIVALQAGTCLRVQWANGDPSPDHRQALARLLVTGIGERRAEGFGRFLVDPPHLRGSELTVHDRLSQRAAGAHA